MARSVRVHDDTHRALKELKARDRSRSIDQVIREMIAETTGTQVGAIESEKKVSRLTSFLDRPPDTNGG